MQVIEATTPDAVHALTTTRNGGHSPAPYASLNLADHVGDDHAAVAKNRDHLITELDLPSTPAWLEQVHGTHVVELDGSAPPSAPADAAITRSSNVVLAVLTADCLPVVISDSQGTAVGVVHAGWRSLSAGVIEATINALGLDPARLKAWLGPAIGPAVYEVGGEIREAFVSRDAEDAQAFRRSKEDKWMCNMYRLGARRLASAGVTDITGGTLCTYTDAEQFFSYRRDDACGRMATLAWLD